MMRRPMRRGPGLVRAAAGTAVIAGTAGAVHHRQEQRWANQAADQQAQADQVQMQSDMAQMQDQMAAQQAQLAAAQQAAYQAQVAAAQQQPVPAAPAAAPASGSSDRIAQLQQLASLKQAGVLSDAEFEAEKAKILAGG